MPGEVAIETLAPGQRIASWLDFVLVHLARVPEAVVAHAITARGVASGEPSRLGLIYVVERGGVGVPSAEAREAFIELSRTSDPYYAASALVIPGGGLAAATAHTFVGGVRAMSGGRLPLAILATLPAAIGALRQTVPRITRLPSDDAIEAMVERMRVAAASE